MYIILSENSVVWCLCHFAYRSLSYFSSRNFVKIARSVKLTTATLLKQTELLGASVVEDLFDGRVESDASHDVADLGAVYKPVSTVPEVEQVEHLFHVYTRAHVDNYGQQTARASQ